MKSVIGWAILAVFIILGTVYSFATPVFEAPDEPFHFALVKHYADGGELLLPQTNLDSAWGQEAGQPPLYYFLAGFLVSGTDTSDFDDALAVNPYRARMHSPLADTSLWNKNYYVHQVSESWPYRGTALAVHLVRLLSVLMGAITVYMALLLSRTLWPTRPWIGLGAAAMVAFNPQFIFISSTVNNDNLVTALSAIALWLMTALAVGRLTLYRTLALGGVLGLALLSKASALVLLPAAVASIVVSDGQPWRLRARSIVLCLAACATVAGWWFLSNHLRTGDPIGVAPHLLLNFRRHHLPGFLVLLSELQDVARSYWAAFGWGHIRADPIIYLFFATYCCTGALGLLVTLARRGRGRLVRAQQSGLLVLAVASLGALLGLFVWMRVATPASFGRLVFPVAPALSALLTYGTTCWLPCRARPAVTLGLGVAALAIAAAVPWVYLAPAYDRGLVEETILDDVERVEFHWGDGVSLVGYSISPADVGPAEAVEVRLYWRCRNRVSSHYWLWVQLAPLDLQAKVAAVDTVVGRTVYPTAVWQPDDLVEQHVILHVDESASTPALYWLRLGLYRPGEEQLELISGYGDPIPGGVVRLSPIRVTTQVTAQPERSVDFQLGDAIGLVGYDWRGDGITLYWQALADVDRDLTVFVHVLDPGGELIAQADGPPRQGDYPTWAWRPGDVVPDTHEIGPIPEGRYDVAVGLYDPENGGLRLPVYAGETRMPDDVILLAEIQVLPDLDAGSDPSGG